jgi:hypothetical protein
VDIPRAFLRSWLARKDRFLVPTFLHTAAAQRGGHRAPVTRDIIATAVHLCSGQSRPLFPATAVSVFGFRLRLAGAWDAAYVGNQISTTSGNPSRLGLPTAWDGCYPIRFAFLSRRTRESRGMRQDALLPRFGVYQNF